MSDYVDVPSSGNAKDEDDIVVDATAGGVVLLAANPHRKSALIINVGTENMRVTTDGSAPTSTHGKRVSVGASLALSSLYCPTSVVKAICEGAINTAANASEVV